MQDQNRAKEGVRTINVVVPEEVYWHVRRCATESKVSMKEFMARFCLGARPYADEEESLNHSPSEQPAVQDEKLNDAA